MIHMVAIIMHVAAGNIEEDIFGHIISHVIKGEDFPEDPQLEMAEAMSKNALFN